MSFLTPDEAKFQVRDLALTDDQIQPYIDDAESYCVGFLDRTVYMDDDAKAAGQAAAPTTLDTALAGIAARTTAANALTDITTRNVTLDVIAADQNSAIQQYTRDMLGIVINARILAGMKMMLGHLYQNREAVSVDVGVQPVEVPLGVTNLLFNDRRLGV